MRRPTVIFREHYVHGSFCAFDLRSPGGAQAAFRGDLPDTSRRVGDSRCASATSAVMHFGAGAAANGAIDEIDWVAFMHADGLSTHTQQLRSQLAWLAGYEGL